MSKDKDAKDTKEEGKEEPKDPATLAKELEGKIKFNRILLIVAIALLVLGLCILGTGFGVIYIRVSALTDAPQDQIEHELEKINKELADLKTFREDELASVASFNEKILVLQGQHESIDSATMKQVLLDREKDYQELVDTLRNSTESLGGMVPGSRDWVTFYKNEMDSLKQHSIRRVSAIESTSDESDKETTASTTATKTSASAAPPAEKK